ncbi:hypothetical protein BX616_010684 [Lobosporangium transversale]|uniref:Uncharacterized protein n=1 Tax=Lobosporangium transversale TaxID=64571 RepID=A0A1Y2G7U8_9FUNG|nr:hypothetical protein BCR41DRAFT_390664 [Lobosporangium transversale]KAF9917987.1 hypothetical protein BX616_010684 [Lobosporangium transversale]ORY97038.1 hypothetical protein BCR41DRAFT_390664 [Lobosporangium transversale]|eukprot:XP_021875584.1 hypothetical protein BCR41DRAFT_390664 [Lobosporangium transversale]
MDSDSPYDDWSRHIHAIITFLKPYFDDWRSYVSIASMLLGIGVLIMESQVLLRMRMGRLEIIGYVIWCLISSILGPIFDILVMAGLFFYCRRKSGRLHITNESIAKALLPAPVAKNYQVMGGVCIAATALTLTSNILYMLRGWKEPSQFFGLASNAVRWLTSQIWYAIGMIFLFHVVTRPAQSGVVFFGKFPRDLWAYKWYLCILYIPVRYMLLELCNVHKDTKEILIPLEILVDIMLYNGPFLTILLRLLYLAWKVAYDEAVLTGAIFEDGGIGSNPLDGRFTDGQRRAATSSGGRTGGGDYVGLAMVDLDEVERGQAGSEHGEAGSRPKKPSNGLVAEADEDREHDEFVLEDEDDEIQRTTATASSPPEIGNTVNKDTSKSSTKKDIMFEVDTDDERTDRNDDSNNRDQRSPNHGGLQEQQSLL